MQGHEKEKKMDRHIYDMIYDGTDGIPIDCPRVNIF